MNVIEVKYFPNPWWDSRNTLSPREFQVLREPVASFDAIDCYKVLSEHQQPSVLAVLNRDRELSSALADTLKGRGAYALIVGQYVTADGAKRSLLGA